MPKNKTSIAQIEASRRYTDRAYDRINIALPKGTKDMVKAVADLYGDTVNHYLNCVISYVLREEIRQPGTGFHKVDHHGNPPESSALYNAIASVVESIPYDPPENDPSDSTTP